MLSDSDLLRELQSGNESAWDEAFSKLYSVAFHAARTPLAGLDPSEAEDVAIEALTQLVPKARTVRSFHELRALAATIATRRAVSDWRKIAAKKRGGGRAASLDELLEESGSAFEPTELAEGLAPAELSELAELLRDAMADLDERTATALRAFLVDGATYKELAQQLQLPMGSVGVLLARGLKKIRARLDRFPRLMKELQLHLR